MMSLISSFEQQGLTNEQAKVEAFNALRNDVSSKKISQEDAYLQVVALLDFNINK